MNTFQTIDSGSGLLKDAYSVSGVEAQGASEALAARLAKLKEKRDAEKSLVKE